MIQANLKHSRGLGGAAALHDVGNYGKPKSFS